jgi:hypothetical protein
MNADTDAENVDEPLGPFQAIWSAWNESDEAIKQKPLHHFQRAIEIQFEELEAHIAAGDREAAAREATDVISISLNMLRWLGYEPAEVSDIVRSRAELRMRDQTDKILGKYARLYGI